MPVAKLETPHSYLGLTDHNIINYYAKYAERLHWAFTFDFMILKTRLIFWIRWELSSSLVVAGIGSFLDCIIIYSKIRLFANPFLYFRIGN